MNTRIDYAALSAEVGFDVLATALDHQFDCRMGFCNHPECHRKAEKRFAAVSAGNEVKTTISGEDLDAADEYRKDCKRGLCHHAACHAAVEQRIARANRRPVRALGKFPKHVPLRADGSIDKRQLRQLIHFGTAN